MRSYIFLLIFCFSFFLVSFSQEKHDFISPLNIPLTLSGTFGEIRTNHFHSGIDIPTNQKKGYPIFACADGYVSRLKVSPWGFGKAIYLNHPNGLTTVYAHLENFNPKIKKYILKKQYENKKFSLDLTLENNTFVIKQGEIIGYSGSSGNSTGPHLHFEVRNSKSQKPINPMNFSFPIKDTQKPIIKSIFIYEIQSFLKTKRKEYPIKENTINPVLLSGNFAIGIETYDTNDMSSIKTGINSIKIYLDSELYYHFEINKFSFSEKRYINSHIDYKERYETGRKIHKCFLEKNNKLSTYKKHVNQGIMSNLTDGIHKVQIIVSDSYNNTSELNFSFNYVNKNVEKITQNNRKHNDYYINSNDNFIFKNDNVNLTIEKGNLYQDCKFFFEETQMENENTIYQIGNPKIPVHKKIKLSIKPDYYIEEDKNKLSLAQLKNNNWSYIKSNWKNGELHGTSKSFGKFTVKSDKIKPVIKTKNLTKNMSEKKSIRFYVSDNFSGIDYYSATLNGKWILMEYDPKKNRLEHFFLEEKKNEEQKLVLTVFDGLGNKNEKEFYFIR